MRINLKACSLALAVALMSTVAHGATKEEIVVCEAVEELSFAIMNGRQNLIKKEIFLNEPSATKESRAIIYRAYAEPEVPVHDIAYAVRDFARGEYKRCIARLAI